MGLATGRIVLDALAERGIVVTNWRWRYSPSIPRFGGQFPPHRELAGSFHNWRPSSSQPTEGGWYPGDHAQNSKFGGCLCDVIPVFRDTATGRFV